MPAPTAAPLTAATIETESAQAQNQRIHKAAHFQNAPLACFRGFKSME